MYGVMGGNGFYSYSNYIGLILKLNIVYSNMNSNHILLQNNNEKYLSILDKEMSIKSSHSKCNAKNNYELKTHKKSLI
jgi:hypothetical protein